MKLYTTAIIGAAVLAVGLHFAKHNYSTAQNAQEHYKKPIAFESGYVKRTLKGINDGTKEVYCFRIPGGLDGSHEEFEKGIGLTISEIFAAERESGHVGRMPSPKEMGELFLAINTNATLATGRTYCAVDENGSTDLEALTRRGISQYKATRTDISNRIQNSKDGVSFKQ